MIRVTEGDQVRIVVKNELPAPTTIHWHGVEVPNAMDGVPGVTQDPIQPGETFTYKFAAKPAGTFMYHSHYEGDIQVGAGLYAPFIIDPKTPEAKPASKHRGRVGNPRLVVAAAITHAAPGSRAGAQRTCAVSSWHNLHLLSL